MFVFYISACIPERAIVVQFILRMKIRDYYLFNWD
jgi:hypothetical protein